MKFSFRAWLSDLTDREESDRAIGLHPFAVRRPRRFTR